MCIRDSPRTSDKKWFVGAVCMYYWKLLEYGVWGYLAVVVLPQTIVLSSGNLSAFPENFPPFIISQNPLATPDFFYPFPYICKSKLEKKCSPCVKIKIHPLGGHLFWNAYISNSKPLRMESYFYSFVEWHFVFSAWSGAPGGQVWALHAVGRDDRQTDTGRQEQGEAKIILIGF